MDTGDRVGVRHELGHGTENEVGKGHRLEIKDSGDRNGGEQSKGGVGKETEVRMRADIWMDGDWSLGWEWSPERCGLRFEAGRPQPAGLSSPLISAPTGRRAPLLPLQDTASLPSPAGRAGEPGGLGRLGDGAAVGYGPGPPRFAAAAALSGRVPTPRSLVPRDQN